VTIDPKQKTNTVVSNPLIERRYSLLMSLIAGGGKWNIKVEKVFKIKSFIIHYTSLITHLNWHVS